MNVENAYSKFVELMPEWIRRQNEIVSEQDTRFQVINRLLTEVLGWSFSDMQTEPQSATGFIDYLLKSHGRNRFVVEAKRVGTRRVVQPCGRSFRPADHCAFAASLTNGETVCTPRRGRAGFSRPRVVGKSAGCGAHDTRRPWRPRQCGICSLSRNQTPVVDRTP